MQEWGCAGCKHEGAQGKNVGLHGMQHQGANVGLACGGGKRWAARAANVGLDRVQTWDHRTANTRLLPPQLLLIPPGSAGAARLRDPHPRGAAEGSCGPWDIWHMPVPRWVWGHPRGLAVGYGGSRGKGGERVCTHTRVHAHPTHIHLMHTNTPPPRIHQRTRAPPSARTQAPPPCVYAPHACANTPTHACLSRVHTLCVHAPPSSPPPCARSHAHTSTPPAHPKCTSPCAHTPLVCTPPCVHAHVRTGDTHTGAYPCRHTCAHTHACAHTHVPLPCQPQLSQKPPPAAMPSCPALPPCPAAGLPHSCTFTGLPAGKGPCLLLPRSRNVIFNGKGRSRWLLPAAPKRFGRGSRCYRPAGPTEPPGTPSLVPRARRRLTPSIAPGRDAAASPAPAGQRNPATVQPRFGHRQPGPWRRVGFISEETIVSSKRDIDLQPPRPAQRRVTSPPSQRRGLAAVESPGRGD